MNIFFSKSTARAAMTLLLTLFCTLPAWAEGFTPASGSGTSTDPYVISTTDQWNSLCQSYSDRSMTDGHYYKLGNDISVSTMLGTDGHKFVGTFDGNNHTLTFTLNTTEQYAAPFRYVNGATISNLHTSGSITTSAKFAGGIVGHANGTNTITNTITSCYSDISINSSINDDGTYGGLVSNIQDGIFNIEGCVFSGKLTGSTTKNCGGFVGFTGGSATLTIRNSLFAPSELSTMAGAKTFARYHDVNDVTIANSYYTQTFGTAQGTQAYAYTELPAGTSMGDKVAEYRWSTAYANGIYFNNVYYNKSDSTAEGFTPASGSGTSTDPYVISTTDQWNSLCQSYSDSILTNGLFYQLGNDISVSTMLGTESRPFVGTFDGKDHTLTFTLETTEKYAAPFRYVKGATISNLHTSGSITTSVKFAGGIVGRANGTNTITNTITSCYSDISINSSINDDGTHGGLVSNIQNGIFNIEGCVFSGKLTGSTTKNCGGFVGYTGGSATLTIRNSLFAPSELSTMAGAQTFARYHDVNDVTIANSYYTQTFGSAQGTQAYAYTELPAGTSMGDKVAEYRWSTAYANGIYFNNVYYNKSDSTAKVVLSSDGETLTFYYDTNTYTDSYALNTESDSPGWRGNTSITTVVFDASFQHARPTTTYQWFEGLSSLATITDIKYLNTSMVENMTSMFYGCSQLSSLDLSGFNTAQVKNMNYMFLGCSKLTSLDLSKFNTTQVKTMSFMFLGCSKLTSLDLSKFNTEKVEDMSYMFRGCSQLTSLDLSGFDTEQVGDMSDMFRGCSQLTSLDLSSFDTGIVTSMGSMFRSCSQLTTLDLSSFNTEKVEDMSSMFEGCSNLKTILASGDFTINYLREENAELGIPEGGVGMFTNCTSLVGGNGTKYVDSDEGNGKTYAHIDGGESNPGYFTNSSTLVTLSNNATNNSTIIFGKTGTQNVYLSGRTLYRDGYWNTICLPFPVSDSDANDGKTFTGTQLEGANAMTLYSASFDEETGTLTLEFSSVDAIEAGKPYIIKWGTPESHPAFDLGNPVFQGVNVKGNTLTTITKGDETNGDLITFTGTYDYQKFTATDRSILFMGAENTLYYPTAGAEIGACRAYFKLADGLTAGDPTSVSNPIKAFVLNFDEDGESNSISTIHPDAPASDAWFTLDGRRLLDAPVVPGIYIRNGHKVLLK